MPRGTRSGRRRRRALSAVLAVLLLLALAGAGGYFWLQSQFQAPGPAAAPSRIEVDPGASVRSVLGRLEATGAVRHARAVEVYLRLRRREPRVMAGTYEIPPHASPGEIIGLFEQGRVVLEQLTIVEGSTFGEFVEALDQHPYVLHTLSGKGPAEIMAALGHPGVHAEGEFFPDTYRFAANTPDVAILG